MSAILKSRRTHGAYATGEEAESAAYRLARLLNGVPMGWVMAVQPRMGAFVLYSCRSEDFRAAYPESCS